MKYAWLPALGIFLFVTIFFQKAGMTGWVISAATFAAFLYFYIAYGDNASVAESQDDEKEVESEGDESVPEEVAAVTLDEEGETDDEPAHEPERTEEEKGAAIDITLQYTVDPKEFLTACYKNDIKKVTEMVEDGIDVEIANHQDVSALMFAVKGKAYEVVRYLIENEADVIRISTKGTTAIKIAEANGDEKMKEILEG